VPARPRLLAAAIALVLACPAAAWAQDAVPKHSAFEGNGVWIWYVSKSSSGNPDAIAARARASGIQTLFVKSSDGTTWWPQFSRGLVSAMHARGLQVCAWQFVYGSRPRVEAALGTRAVRNGADCLVIDAESRYEGRYTPASIYIRKLRAGIGADYPLGLAGFPYVDYHPAFPYSVFLGPGGAQFNLPQMYWADIGVSVDEVFAHTYAYNSLYKRPIYPLGQLYGRARPADVLYFRQLARDYGATGVSWWSWQSAAGAGWRALARPITTFAQIPPPQPTPPTLARHARGDLVVWAQQHLVSAGQPVTVTGVFDSATVRGVTAVQSAAGLPVTGAIDPATWNVLLAYEPAGAPKASRAVAKAASKDEISPPAQHGRPGG
jgi:hypothetical protein